MATSKFIELIDDTKALYGSYLDFQHRNAKNQISWSSKFFDYWQADVHIWTVIILVLVARLSYMPMVWGTTVKGDLAYGPSGWTMLIWLVTTLALLVADSMLIDDNKHYTPAFCAKCGDRKAQEQSSKTKCAKCGVHISKGEVYHMDELSDSGGYYDHNRNQRAYVPNKYGACGIFSGVYFWNAFRKYLKSKQLDLVPYNTAKPEVVSKCLYETLVVLRTQHHEMRHSTNNKLNELKGALDKIGTIKNRMSADPTDNRIHKLEHLIEIENKLNAVRGKLQDQLKESESIMANASDDISNSMATLQDEMDIRDITHSLFVGRSATDMVAFNEQLLDSMRSHFAAISARMEVQALDIQDSFLAEKELNQFASIELR